MPSYAERLEELIAGYKRIFGDDVYVAEDTMDYQLLSLIAKCWDDLNSMILDTYNARNPNYATGTALDLLLPLNGIIRRPATQSKVTLTLTGVPGTTLEAGMQAMDADGNVWEIPEEIAFPASETAEATVEAEAYCTKVGAVAAGIGTITIMNTQDSHWMGVTNLVEAEPGNEIETDAEVRKRRSLSVSLPSRSIISGIHAALLNIAGVESVNVIENSTATDGDIPAHSIAAVVDGGDEAEIARVIWLKKSPGCSIDGDHHVDYVDEYGQENDIVFYRPEIRNTVIEITLRTFAVFESSLLEEAIPAAVAASVNALGIGEDLIVGLLNAVIYNANTTGYPIFSVTGLRAYEEGEEQSTTTTDALQAGFKVRYQNNGNATVTQTGENVWKIEVGLSEV